MDNDANFNHDKYIAERRAKHGAYAGLALTAITILGLAFTIPKFLAQEASTPVYRLTIFTTLITLAMVALIGFCSWRLFKHKSWKSALALVFFLTLILISSFFTHGRPNTIIVIVMIFAIRGLVGARKYQKINTTTMADTFD